MRGLGLGALLLAAALGPALAQSPFDSSGRGTRLPCVLDKCLNDASRNASPPPAPSFPDPGRARTAPGAFDFYVLSLSWSPGFCDTGGAAKARNQCADGAGLGFVVHGLWPQNRRGYPSDCGAGQFPSRAAIAGTRGLYPDEGLARYEWRKHGTCTGLSPTDYFAQVRAARNLVAIPPDLSQPSDPQTLEPAAIARAFTDANRGLRDDMMAVTCRAGELQEVRICFTKDLRGFTPCPEIARESCRARSVSVLPAR